METNNLIGLMQLFITALGATLIFLQIKKDSKWNKRKSAHDTLNELVSNDFGQILDELIIEFDWDIVSPNNNYIDIKNSLEEAKKYETLTKLNAKTSHLLRRLEVITISCEKELVDEDVCKVYLFNILLNVYGNTLSFIEQERKRRKEDKVFEHVSFFAAKWKAEAKF